MGSTLLLEPRDIGKEIEAVKDDQGRGRASAQFCVLSIKIKVVEYNLKVVTLSLCRCSSTCRKRKVNENHQERDAAVRFRVVGHIIWSCVIPPTAS